MKTIPDRGMENAFIIARKKVGIAGVSQRNVVKTLLAALFLLPVYSLAAQGESASVLGLSEANVLWLFLGGILVFFYAGGLCRPRNGSVAGQKCSEHHDEKLG